MGTWITGVVVSAIIGLAVGKVYKDSKNRVGCGCGGCSNCPKYDDHKSD